MSLVNEAVVDGTVQRMLPEGQALSDLSPTEQFRLREIVVTVLNAGAALVGGEAIRQDKAEAWERAQVKYPCVGDLGELLADDAHSTPCPACALKAVAEILGIEVTG